jgi:TonB family protein
MRISRLWPFLFVLSACSSATATAGGEPAGPCADFAGDLLPDGRAIRAVSDSLAHAAASLPDRGLRQLVLLPVSAKPVLKNRDLVAQAFASIYPPLLQDANVRARIRVAFWVDTSGQPHDVQLVRGAPDPRMNTATLQIVESFQFQPARQGRCPVPFFVAMPVTWAPSR